MGTPFLEAYPSMSEWARGAKRSSGEQWVTHTSPVAFEATSAAEWLNAEQSWA